MRNDIFREKSLDKVSSPEALNDYVKVASPSVWMVLVSIIILLMGICIWGALGHLDTKVNIGVISKNGESVCYIAEKNINTIKEGQMFEVSGVSGEILAINSTPIQGKTLDPLMLHALNINGDDWVYEANISHSLADGEYESHIITDSVSPMYFIFNQ